LNNELISYEFSHVKCFFGRTKSNHGRLHIGKQRKAQNERQTLAAKLKGFDSKLMLTEAQRTRKRIILYVGGPWCPFCRQMDELFQKDPDLTQLRESHFITVAVHYGTGNIHDRALSHYPHVLGIPHFYVLESDGTLLHSQHVVDLRENGAYSPSKLTAFFTQWARPEPVAINKAK